MIDNKTERTGAKRADGLDRMEERGKSDVGSKDIRAHNRESLEALLAHVDEQCRERCEEIAGRASAEADTVRRTARERAEKLLDEVRERERRNLDEQLRVERARQQSRIRQRELAEQRAMAEKGLAYVREALVELWNSGDRARTRWLARALTDARAVLATDRWQLRHAEGWSPDRSAASTIERVAPNVEIDWTPDPALTEGFVIRAGKARVDATAAGLTARGERIAGVLLAQLPSLDRPALDSAPASSAGDKEASS